MPNYVWLERQPSCPSGRSYGFTNFIGDAFMIAATCGLWIIWIVIREISR